MARINIDKLCLAPIIQDEIGTGNLTFSVPTYLEGIQQIQVKVNTDTAKGYEEGVLRMQDTTLTDIAISIDLGHLSNADYAKYLGHHVATEGGVYALEDDIAPDLAILIKYTKNGGKHGYKVFYKGQLTEPSDTIKQKEGKVDYQNHTVESTFSPLKNNGMWSYSIDEDDPDCPENIDTVFFASVIIPTEKVGA
jgi:phi13 family phage major tail protein